MAPPDNPLDNIVVVLHQPRRMANIGGSVRAMKNMGLRRLRLVQPAEYDEGAIEGIAHRSADVRAGVAVYDQLDAALADAVYVVGTTARTRERSALVSDPRTLAPELLARAASGPVALLFGPEDHGLTNADLDRCDRLLAIPADPGYSSLNLSHAVLLTTYELRLASAAAPPPRAHAEDPASAAQAEQLFEAIEQALWGIEFFKAQRATAIMRTVRALIRRAEPSAREATLIRAMCLEALAFMRRKGIAPGERAE